MAFTQGHQCQERCHSLVLQLTRSEHESVKWIGASNESTISLLNSLARRYEIKNPRLKARSIECMAIQKSLKSPLKHANEVAIVTGAGPASIAEAIVAQLLEGGATVIVCSRLTTNRRAHFKGFSGNMPVAEAHSIWFRLIKAILTTWRLSFSGFMTLSSKLRVRRVLVKRPWTPTLFFPFRPCQRKGSDDHRRTDH